MSEPTPPATIPVFRDDAYLTELSARVIAADEQGIILDRTIFYPQGGGQPGDRGVLVLSDGGQIVIEDTRKGAAPGVILHLAAAGAVLPPAGASVIARIDWPYRHRLMRMHSCLHLLSSLVPGGVTGGQVGDGKGRLDFDVSGEGLDKEAITARLNALIAADHPIETRWITDEELAARPDLVRTMSVKPPTGQGRVRLLEIVGVDLQPCGGTHVRSTGEIGPVAVTKIENKGRQNRRLSVSFVA